MSETISVRGSAKPWFSDRAWGNLRDQVSEYFDQRAFKDEFIHYHDEGVRKAEAIDNETRYYLELNLVDRMNENRGKVEARIKERLLGIFPENDISVSISFTHGSLVFDAVLNILGDLGHIYAAEQTVKISYSLIDKIISHSVMDEIKREVNYKNKGAILHDMSITHAVRVGGSQALHADGGYLPSSAGLEKIYKALLVLILLVSFSIFLFLINLYVANH